MSDCFGYLHIFESAVGLRCSRYSTLYVLSILSPKHTPGVGLSTVLVLGTCT